MSGQEARFSKTKELNEDVVSIFEPWHLILLVAFLLLVTLLVVVIAVIMRSNKKKEANTALNILKERYARGEINEDDFKRIKKDLI